MDFSRIAGSGQALVQGALVFGWLIAVLIHQAYPQISPGDLSNAHQSLSGSGHCGDCHDAGKRPPEFKCISCHKDIRDRIQGNRGLHPSLVGADRSGRVCAQCHNEHNGRAFNLIHWTMPLSQFDHASTGYRLEAKHSRVECRRCHKADNIPGASRTSIVIRDLNRTYLGLSTLCSGCHADPHQGELTDRCDRCHDFEDWKRPARFNHRNARFNLEGSHEKVDCIQCHSMPATGRAVRRYRNLQFEDCTPCHKDPHGGTFKDACRTCHSAKTSWKSIHGDDGFNHSRTRFPLEGRHVRVECTGCHLQAKFSRPLVFEKCRDCHSRDPHQGQFDAERLPRDCGDCHTVNGFTPTTFDVARHSATRFPLEEHHRIVRCADCHKANGAKAVVYRMRDISCIACHRDIHLGQFSDERYNNHCEKCHNQSTFKPSLFSAPLHASTRFPLSGGHERLQCSQCHKGGAQPVQYRFDDRSCPACHSDLHRGQFTLQMQDRFPDGTAKSCRACHTVNSWHELDSFNHAATEFRLEGAHKRAECIKCHKPPLGKAAIADIVYKDAPQQCTGCHQDPHKGQFTSRMRTPMPDGRVGGCSSCHSINAWAEVTFDHATTRFPLSVAHQSVKCERCHSKSAGGIVRYSGTPQECIGCHEDAHAGQFAVTGTVLDCGRCHPFQKWVPSSFDHEKQSTFALTGAHKRVACVLCHSDSMDVKGKKVVVYKGTKRECTACHGLDTSGKRP